MSTNGEEHIPLESTSPSRKPTKDAGEWATVRTSLHTSNKSSSGHSLPRARPFTSTAAGQEAGRGRAWISVLRAGVHHTGVKGRVGTCPGGGGNDDRDERHLGQCSQSPCPAQQGKTLAGLGQGGAREQGPETTDKRSGPEKSRAITCSVQMVVETTGPSLQGNCPRASSWVGNTRS